MSSSTYEFRGGRGSSKDSSRVHATGGPASSRTNIHEQGRNKNRVNQIKNRETKSTEPDIAELPEEERLEKAKKMMEESQALELSLEVGEMDRITQDIIVEKTSDGFIVYNILD
ncbi:hypothetical protein [Halalkalicoccus tibetensis]|uniref:Uncharacterized protein n=1 Tax=Halalkalicoccus tibetensis TaxID=175632 RepID=A0ABD5UYM1_9EURY